MIKIPEQFTKILDRLNEINVGLFSQTQIGTTNYKKDIQDFNIIARIGDYKETSESILLEIEGTLKEIYSQKIDILNRLPDQYAWLSEEDTGIPGGDMLFEDPRVLRPDCYIKMTPDYKSKLYKKVSLEIDAYATLIKRSELVKKHKNSFLKDDLTASGIINFEFADKVFISQDVKSQDDFEKLLIKTDLTPEEIKLLTIKVGCNNEEAAYIFEKLINENFLPGPLCEIHHYGCFYNKNGEQFQTNLKPYSNKFIKGGEDKEQLRGEIDTEISNMVKIILHVKTKK